MGERGSYGAVFTLSPVGLRVPHKIMPARRPPSPLRERVGVRGNIWL